MSTFELNKLGDHTKDKSFTSSEEVLGGAVDEIDLTQLLGDSESSGPIYERATIEIQNNGVSGDGSKKLGLKNDLIFAYVLKQEQIAIPLLSAITGRKIAKILRVKEQETLTSLESSIPDEQIVSNDQRVGTVRLDVLMIAEASEQRYGSKQVIADWEVQDYAQDFFFRRVRLYGAALDTAHETRVGKNKYAVGERYMISFVSTVVHPMLSSSLAYQVCKMKNQVNEVVDDSSTWVIVNYDRLDDLIRERAPAEVLAVVRQLNRMAANSTLEKQIANEVQKFLDNEDWRSKAMTFEDKLDLAKNQGRQEERQEMLTSMVEAMRAKGNTWKEIAELILQIAPGTDLSLYQF